MTSSTKVGDGTPPTNWLGAWETSADLAYCRDPAGRILGANLAFARKFGRPATSLVDVPANDFLHADDRVAFQAAELELRRPPHRATTAHRWVTPQGVRWFAWDEAALHDADGHLTAVRSVGRDITRQRLAEEQFFRLSLAVEQSPVAIVITDLDGRAQYVNAKFIEVTGRTLEDILDGNIEVLRDGHPDQASYEQCWTTLRAGGEWRGELATRRAELGTVWESVKISCLRSSGGEITNFLCLREDITDRKKLERDLRQAQKMESLGTLAGGIAHDFNNLLAIISGYTEFCQQGVQDPAMVQKGLREIQRAAERAGGLVRQILTFSRKTEVRFSPVDFNQLVRELVAMMAETFPRTVTLQLELSEQLPPLTADQSQMQQILLNLCVNARDAMPAGGSITLTTSTRPGPELQHLGANPALTYACLQVSDTGVGMSAEVRQRLFEPFFTTKAANGGTGLGLAVVYGIVIAHHGYLDVDSTPGQGSTFRIYLPLVPRANLPAPVILASDFPGGTESLLVVDDEESLRTLLAGAFGRKGYRTLQAASGLEAIEIIGDLTKPIDAVMLDLNMPGASGIEVLKVIRICRPKVSVLVTSGHITPEARREFEQLGQRTIVQKPYRLDQLGRQLRALLDGRTPAAV